MKSAIYVRVSTQDQNLDNQINPLVVEATRRGLEYELFKEKESSRNTRPIKEELLSRLRRGEFRGVLVWKLDRWGRSVRELALELDEFAKRGIEFISLSDGIDMSTPQGRLQAHLLSAFAEFERELISERTKAGLARTKAKGTKLGRPRGTSFQAPELTKVSELMGKGLEERKIAKELGTSRYRVHIAVEQIKKINAPQTGGVLPNEQDG